MNTKLLRNFLFFLNDNLNPLSANPTKRSNKLKQFVNNTDESFECVWPFCGVGTWRVNPVQASVLCLYPLKTRGFLTFSGGVEKWTSAWNGCFSKLYNLTLSWRRPLSYRNQSINLLWFAEQINGLISIW